MTCLHRSKYKYIYLYYLPSSLFVILSWISFLIPPEIIAGRMAMLITLFLVLINFFIMVTRYISKHWQTVANMHFQCQQCIFQQHAALHDCNCDFYLDDCLYTLCVLRPNVLCISALETQTASPKEKLELRRDKEEAFFRHNQERRTREL